MTVPIATSPGRSGFGPQLSLSYDSGAGNGPFGLGWNLSLPAITRKTDKGLPKYQDADESDVFLISGAEDLVPVFRQDANGNWIRNPHGDFLIHENSRTVGGVPYLVRRYRPRIEGLFSRIERWTNTTDQTDVFWRSISKDNITTWYGKTGESRITDPTDATHIFSWLICESYDDKGNVIAYRYKAEDSSKVDLAQANEANRNDTTRQAQRYLRRVCYGNSNPYLPQLEPGSSWPVLPGDDQWLFEAVFDYGEHDSDAPQPNDSNLWPVRSDPFSSYRAGFEVRTYRLCRRALMFHHFPGGAGYDGLVRATEFTYAEGPLASLMSSATQSGFKLLPNGSYLKKSLPPLEFSYSEATIESEIREVDPDSLENLPMGLDGSRYQWVDLDGEGLSGILTEQAEGWFYKRNLSPTNFLPDGERVQARFAPLELVASKPVSGLNGGRAQFLDLAGDGQLDLVTFHGPTPGFYERTPDEAWDPFVPFESLPVLDWGDPNLKFVDLTGDGQADILITEDDVFSWHPSLAEEGFGPRESTRQSHDEEQGPRLVFADGTQSIYLTDMSGDGLTDLARVRNGEVCYWPNLGYGRFGAKVTMDNSPWFDHPDRFDQKRVRLADIDGFGTTDICYLHGDGVRLYFNQSGNSWSQPPTVPVFPRIDSQTAVTVVDLLGNGTACLLWSSPLPGDARQPMRYIDLMGGQKPHLLVKTVNNLGAETHVHYAPSTKFYLQDQYSGNPWVTKLPFPVHVVERVETYDHISRNRFVTRYAYHHGYFDGEEREFRGFGMVEQWDTEALEDYVEGVQRVEGTQELAPELNQPPVTTRTWYHTGAFLDLERIVHQFRHEYYRQEQHIPEPILPAGLSADELRECFRALKGLPLRHEIYSFDGSPKEKHPYTVGENNFEIRLIQPRGNQRHAIFLPVGRESISLNYERNPADPRIAHSLGLDLDQYGNARKSCSVVYGRKIADPALPAEVTRDQQKLYVAYSETDYTPDIKQENPTDTYRLRVSYESRGYEITGISPTSSLFHFDDIKAKIAGTAEIDYEVVPDGANPQKRLLSHGRTLFLDNALNPLPLGQRDSLGLRHQSYKLAFTPGVTGAHYAGKINDAEFAAAGYLHFNGDANWWIPFGTAIYPANPADHFYLPIGAKDPLGVETVATLDPYDLLVEKVEVKQAAWNVITAVNDYRVLGPVLMTDSNKNRSAVEVDALGLVIKTAIMGKAGSADGDTLADPTTRIEYELFNWVNNRKPNVVHTFAREKHGTANPRWQESYTHSNGSGGVAMVKAPAHPGKAFKVNPDGSKAEVDADPRWIGNGRTIWNNKGKPVKQYEPYFSTTHEYEDEKALREIGATPVFYYDAIGRNILTLFPNGTFAKVEFDPWMQMVFDANDTVKQSHWYTDRGSPDPDTQPEPVNDPERRAAWLAAKHADTPEAIHFDSLGRPVYAISDYGDGKTAAVRSESDLTGRFSKIFDHEQREVASGFIGMAGTPVVADSAEKGRRWTFQNVLGALVKVWDEHGRQFRSGYDILHRPVSTFVQEAGNAEILFNYVVYGDRLANAEQLNLLGTAHQIFDQAGMVRVPELDFKGNPKLVDRVLAKDYKTNLDWTTLASQPDYAAIQAAANPALEIGEVFTAKSQYDALSRPTQVVLPDGTVILPTYNEASFMASLQAKIRGQGNFIEFLKDQDYDAKGQRQFAHFGSEVFIRYFYDPNTFRLTNLLTCKSSDDPDRQALQNLRYTYDPVGHITQVRDDAQQTHYFNNAVVRPESLYEYDATYQLIRATGREHAGPANDTLRTHADLDFVPQLPHANDADAVRTYTEEYEYDLLGNIKLLKHRFQPQPGIGNGWTRRYRYAFEDNPANRTNRLNSTSLTGDPDAGPYSGTYDYDAYGNMTRMPHLATMEWNFMEQLRKVDLGGGGTAHYIYGLGGQRTRKVIESNGNLKLEWIFLGGVTIFRRRRRDTDEVRLERWTTHISDNTGHIAQVDTKTRDEDNSDPANPLNIVLIRYQYSNHLGSAVLETDENGNPISYEEYHPYGTTAYRSAKPGFDLSLKRYRFSGKERDDETGLNYFGARYYAAWLGRWTSTDPAGFLDGLHLFKYCRNNPVTITDRIGLQGEPATDPFKYPISSKDFTGFENPTVEQFRAVMKLDPRINETNSTITFRRDPFTSKGNAEVGRQFSGGGGTWTLTAILPTGPTEETAPQCESSTPPAAPPESSPPQTESAPMPEVTDPASSYFASELATSGAVRGVDTAKKAKLASDVERQLSKQTNLQVLQRISKFAYDARQFLRRVDQASGGILNRVTSRLLDKNSGKSWAYFVRKALDGERGEQALAQAYRSVAANASIGRGFANVLGAAGRVLGGVLGPISVVLAGQSLYRDIASENYGDVPVDSASVASGGLATYAAITGSVALGTVAAGIGLSALGYVAAEWAGGRVGNAVTEATGSRGLGRAAGAATGAGIGAAVGAAVGAVFFGIGAVPGAAIGAAIGALAGFLGAY